MLAAHEGVSVMGVSQPVLGVNHDHCAGHDGGKGHELFAQAGYAIMDNSKGQEGGKHEFVTQHSSGSCVSVIECSL